MEEDIGTASEIDAPKSLAISDEDADREVTHIEELIQENDFQEDPEKEVDAVGSASRIAALTALGISEDDAERKIAHIEEWIEKNDFPEHLERHMIEMFLMRTKFRTEVTKKKIAMYYKIRRQMPEFFKKKHPKLINMQQAMKVSYYVFSPKLTPELYTVNFFKLNDVNPKNYIPNDFCGHLINNLELKLIRDGYSLGCIYVCDLKGSTFSHLYYFGVGTLRKVAKIIQEVYPVPIKAIHFVNCPGYMNTLIALIKAVLNPKIFNRIHIHKNPKDVANYISKDILPEEFGGEGESLEELNEYMRGQFVKYQKRYDELQHINEVMMRG